MAGFHLANNPVSCTEYLNDQLKILNVACDGMTIDIERLKGFSKVRFYLNCPVVHLHMQTFLASSFPLPLGFPIHPSIHSFYCRVHILSTWLRSEHVFSFLPSPVLKAVNLVPWYKIWS